MRIRALSNSLFTTQAFAATRSTSIAILFTQIKTKQNKINHTMSKRMTEKMQTSNAFRGDSMEMEFGFFSLLLRSKQIVRSVCTTYLSGVFGPINCNALTLQS